jgi:phosphopantothenoylcysteine decarboxylase/phosphopantothenate--cysteine ligase
MGAHRPRVVVGLTGGIAAFKVVSVIRELVESGCDVHVIPSESALKFVGTATLEAISRNPVHESLFEGVAEVRHVALGQSADVILVAPATANTLSHLAQGRSDTLLLTTVLAASCPVIIAPAMHTEMWENAATSNNVSTLVDRGFQFVGPVAGRLTGDDSGQGRLADTDDIVGSVLAAMAPRDFAGTRVVVSAGGTREPIDPVRFIGNRSTGEMGVRLAEAARRRGASVTLITAHLEVPAPRGITIVDVSTALEMQRAVVDNAHDCDVFISAAAVSDYRVDSPSPSKWKKSAGVPTLTLVENPDILAEFCREYPEPYVVGFAAETNEASFNEFVKAKAMTKGTNLTVGNIVGIDCGFGNTEAVIVLVDASGESVSEFRGSKTHAAQHILDYVSRQRAAQQ